MTAQPGDDLLQRWTEAPDPPEWTAWMQPHWTEAWRDDQLPGWVVEVIFTAWSIVLLFGVLVALLANG